MKEKGHIGRGVIDMVGVMAIFTSFVYAAFLLSSSLTGYTIANISPSSSATGSLLFFILGITGLYILAQSKRAAKSI